MAKAENKYFNINKKILFISTITLSIITITLLILSIILINHHQGNTIYGIKVVLGPTINICLLSLIPSSVTTIIISWLSYLIFKDGLSSSFTGKAKINFMNAILYIVVIVLMIISLVGALMGFIDWNQQLIIK